MQRLRTVEYMLNNTFYTTNCDRKRFKIHVYRLFIINILAAVIQQIEKVLPVQIYSVYNNILSLVLFFFFSAKLVQNCGLPHHLL